jgi:hypothetical protein
MEPLQASSGLYLDLEAFELITEKSSKISGLCWIHLKGGKFADYVDFEKSISH